MAHPKRRHSHSRTRKRQTHQKLVVPQLVVCSQCKRLKPAHMVCPFCGYYKGTKFIEVEKKEKKRKRG